MYINIGTLAMGAVMFFIFGAAFSAFIMAIMRVVRTADRDADRDEIEYLDINAPTDRTPPAMTLSEIKPVIAEDEIRAHPHFAKNYVAFMRKYYPDVMEDPMKKWTTDMYDEYIAWCQSPEGRPYFED